MTGIVEVEKKTIKHPIKLKYKHYTENVIYHKQDVGKI